MHYFPYILYSDPLHINQPPQKNNEMSLERWPPSDYLLSIQSTTPIACHSTYWSRLDNIEVGRALGLSTCTSFFFF